MLNIEKVKITTLSENSVADIDYIAEWGLSVHISVEGHQKILFDTGYRHACTYNARVAGIRLSEIDKIVLSHGHGDHTGGLRSVLETIRFENSDRKHIDIICHPAAIESQHVKHTDHHFYRGCPYDIDELTRLGARFKTSSEPVWITENIVSSGEVPMKTDFESVSSICYLKRGNQYINSTVEDDQALIILTDKGLIIILGCAHRGMINTILHARKITGIDEVYMVIGGTHLLNTSQKQQKMTLEAIHNLGIKKIGVSHCTGMRPASLMAAEIGPKKFFFNNAGAAITFLDGKVKVDAFEEYEV
jgi:7,8-dihydropterin-6-yl-methyl-4-(beta-D-ribofuranosyl)aminobenzene 5'-phosphate synthase